MSSLITTYLSIALSALLTLTAAIYGGTAYLAGKASAEVTQLVHEAQHLRGVLAMDAAMNPAVADSEDGSLNLVRQGRWVSETDSRGRIILTAQVADKRACERVHALRESGVVDRHARCEVVGENGKA